MNNLVREVRACKTKLIFTGDLGHLRVMNPSLPISFPDIVLSWFFSHLSSDSLLVSLLGSSSLILPLDIGIAGRLVISLKLCPYFWRFHPFWRFLLTHMLIASWSMSLALVITCSFRFVFLKAYWTSLLGCSINFINSAYPKLNFTFSHQTCSYFCFF